MPNGFVDKELASRAGKSKGKHTKTKQWEALGDFITQAGAKRAMKVLSNLDDETYLEQYGKLLNYFKPRLQAAHNKNDNKNETSLDLSNAEIVDRINRILAAASGEDVE